MAAEHQEEELLDYEEDEVENAGDAGAKADGQKKGYVGIHSTSFKDFLLKVSSNNMTPAYPESGWLVGPHTAPASDLTPLASLRMHPAQPELVKAIEHCGFEHPSEGAARTGQGRPAWVDVTLRWRAASMQHGCSEDVAR
jgi:hypothetical protein